MATEAQINANRRNAERSTGPSTPEGKANSSRNGLIHGMAAGKHLLPGEDPCDFFTLLQDFRARFQPADPVEDGLVVRLAAEEWRLRRFPVMEVEVFHSRFRDVARADHLRKRQEAIDQKYGFEPSPGESAQDQPDESDLLGRAFILDSAGSNAFTKLARYESRADHAFDRFLRQLQKLQARRPAMTPASPAVTPANMDQPAARSEGSAQEITE